MHPSGQKLAIRTRKWRNSNSKNKEEKKKEAEGDARGADRSETHASRVWIRRIHTHVFYSLG